MKSSETFSWLVAVGGSNVTSIGETDGAGAIATRATSTPSSHARGDPTRAQPADASAALPRRRAHRFPHARPA